MEQEKRNSLEEKRKQLQESLRFEEFYQCEVVPLFEVLQEMQRLKIPYHVVSFRNVPAEMQSVLIERTRTNTLMRYEIPALTIAPQTRLIEGLMERFPPQHTSRYFPNLPVYISSKPFHTVLRKVLKENGIRGDSALLFWLRYAFLLEVDLKLLAENASADIFDIDCDDVIIFAPELSWVIVYNVLENQWRIGKSELLNK